MTEVKFYESIEDKLLRFAVIISKTQKKYVFCKHKDRDTWEIPGGHREQEENIMDTAKRDNFDGEESFGMLFFADIQCFETELHSEIEKIAIMDEFPERWTYPDIQPYLINEAIRLGYI